MLGVLLWFVSISLLNGAKLVCTTLTSYDYRIQKLYVCVSSRHIPALLRVRHSTRMKCIFANNRLLLATSSGTAETG